MMKLSTSKTAATAASRFVSPSQLRVNQAVSKLAAGQQQAARTKATVAAPSIKSAQDQALRYAKYGGLALGLGLAQYQFGTADDFFEHKFTTNKNACDLADFYGTEDFMEVRTAFRCCRRRQQQQSPPVTSFDHRGPVLTSLSTSFWSPPAGLLRVPLHGKLHDETSCLR